MESTVCLRDSVTELTQTAVNVAVLKRNECSQQPSVDSTAQTEC